MSCDIELKELCQALVAQRFVTVHEAEQALEQFEKLTTPAAVLSLVSDLGDYQQGASAEARAADEARAEVRRLTADNRALIKAVRFSAETFGKITSSDGSGHADIGVAVLRIAGLSQPDQIKAATDSQEDTVSGVVRDHAEFELEVLEAGVTAYHGYLRSCSMRESGFMLNAMQAARTAMWDHSMSRPFLFALAEDRTACTLDIDGQAHHYVEDSRVEGLLLDAEPFRWLAGKCNAGFKLDLEGVSAEGEPEQWAFGYEGETDLRQALRGAMEEDGQL